MVCRLQSFILMGRGWQKFRMVGGDLDERNGRLLLRLCQSCGILCGMNRDQSANQLPLPALNATPTVAELTPGIKAILQKNKQEREAGIKPYSVPLPLQLPE
jgi:hypothetical protein